LCGILPSFAVVQEEMVESPREVLIGAMKALVDRGAGNAHDLGNVVASEALPLDEANDISILGLE
jgi:hypothetical protein